MTKSGLKKCSTPNPSHFSQAPAGLLNEKVLGSSSGIEYPHSGHANLFEKRISNDESSREIILAIPFDSSNVVSNDSLSLFSISGLIVKRSTTTSMVLFFFASICGRSSISCTSPLTLSLMKPLDLIFLIRSTCSPFLLLISGATIAIRILFSSFMI